MSLELETGKLAYTLREAAGVLGVCPATVKNRIASGELRSFTWAGRRLLHRDELVAVIEAARAAPNASASLRPTRANRQAATRSAGGPASSATPEQ